MPRRLQLGWDLGALQRRCKAGCVSVVLGCPGISHLAPAVAQIMNYRLGKGPGLESDSPGFKFLLQPGKLEACGSHLTHLLP